MYIIHSTPLLFSPLLSSPFPPLLPLLPLSSLSSPPPPYSLDVMAGPGQEAAAIGFYQFEKVIGKGNFAVVKLATHTITNTKVRGREGGRERGREGERERERESEREGERESEREGEREEGERER